MADSAVPSKRERTAHAIATHAQQLADERGLDGFTMDQLADAAGVSRRTLFNYFPSKLDAVLGEEKGIDTELSSAFALGGPNGDLIADLTVLVTGFLEAKETDATDVARFRRLLLSDPRILHAAHARFERAVDGFSDLITARPDSPIDARGARVLARLLITVFDQAVEDFVDDPSHPLADHFTRTLETAQDLLGRANH